ncbi:spindle assembly abnormal protein 6 homolog [Euwallacea fornicatus]|uniref:spindle assembly abnormal protein 6 homolog n=1 Tax=Euwallacea fornicatus TaxID=995702 RepID=UPI00338E1FC9
MLKTSGKESCLYSGNHLIPIFLQEGYTDDRNLTINILDLEDKLQIKLRDSSDHSFNFTEYIDPGDFELLRHKQSLDINYTEFKTNVVDMLNQFRKKEMFLKCELYDKKCTMVFFTKSKIKSIIYLTLDLRLTDQKEIVAEMYLEIDKLQGLNKRLHNQLLKTQQTVKERELEIQNLQQTTQLVVEKFHKDLENVDHLFTAKCDQFQSSLFYKLSRFKDKIIELHKKVNILKQENHLKASSSDRLIKTLETLRLENIDYSTSMDSLKRENTSLNILRVTLERNVADLKKSLEETQNLHRNFEMKKTELETDLEKLSIIIAQKDSKISELSKDLVQANNMIVRFSNECDARDQQLREYEEDVTVKEKIIMDQKCQIKQILNSFEQYKVDFNFEKFEDTKRNLLMSEKNVDDLKEELRKLNKINAILTQKVSQAGYLIK